MTRQAMALSIVRTIIAGTVSCPDCHFRMETDKDPKKDLIKCPKCGEFMYNDVGVRLFLDDRKNPSEYGLHDVKWVKTYADAVKELATGKVSWISFDHDLGDFDASGKEWTGYDLAKYIELNVHDKKIPCPEWQVHSGNPEGRKNILRAMRSAERFR